MRSVGYGDRGGSFGQRRPMSGGPGGPSGPGGPGGRGNAPRRDGNYGQRSDRRW
jgi:hypothetical protein